MCYRVVSGIPSSIEKERSVSVTPLIAQRIYSVKQQWWGSATSVTDADLTYTFAVAAAQWINSMGEKGWSGDCSLSMSTLI
jgi:hypothetical protein